MLVHPASHHRQQAMKKLAVAILSLAAVTAFNAHAEAFLGVAGGASQWPSATCPGAGSCDRRDGVWSVRAGYMFLPYVGIEARYVDLGKAKSSVTSTTSEGDFSADTTFKATGAGVGVVFAAPLMENFALTGVVGAARMKTSLDTPDVSFPAAEGTVTQIGFHADQTKTNPYYGVGVDYRFAPNLSVGVEATRYRVTLGGSDDVDAFTASLTYHFR